jgi:AcrR family transcriptional regulator
MSRLKTAPRKEPRQARSLATVEAILVATARVLTRDGYDRASTNKIAEEAGVSVGSLYQYFPSKESLVAALIDRHLLHLTALIETNIDVLREAPLPIAARALVKLMIAAHAHNPKLHKVIAEQVPRVGRLNRIHDVDRQIGERVRSLLEKRKDEIRMENLDMAVFVLVTVVESLTHRATVDEVGRFGEDELADAVTDLVVRYVMKDPPLERAARRRPSDGPAYG